MEQDKNKLLEKLKASYYLSLVQFIFFELIIFFVLRTPFFLLPIQIFIYLGLLTYISKRSPKAYVGLILYNVITIIRIIIGATSHTNSIEILFGDVPLACTITLFTYCYFIGYKISRQITSPSFQQTVHNETIQPAPQIDLHVKKQRVIVLLLLTIVTAGIYTPIWFLQRIEAINRIPGKEKLNKNVSIYILLVSSINLLIYIIYIIIGIIFGMKGYSWPTNGINPLNWVSQIVRILTIINQIVIIVQCVKVQRIYNDYFNNQLHRGVSFSQIKTLLFQTFYLQYTINRI
jgi:hypothetical protein